MSPPVDVISGYEKLVALIDDSNFNVSGNGNNVDNLIAARTKIGKIPFVQRFLRNKIDINEDTKMFGNYNENDMVWIKCGSSYGYWPGIVSSISDEGVFDVNFFAASVDENQLASLVGNRGGKLSVDNYFLTNIPQCKKDIKKMNRIIECDSVSVGQLLPYIEGFECATANAATHAASFASAQYLTALKISLAYLRNLEISSLNVVLSASVMKALSETDSIHGRAIVYVTQVSVVLGNLNADLSLIPAVVRPTIIPSKMQQALLRRAAEKQAEKEAEKEAGRLAKIAAREERARVLEEAKQAQRDLREREKSLVAAEKAATELERVRVLEEALALANRRFTLNEMLAELSSVYGPGRGGCHSHMASNSMITGKVNLESAAGRETVADSQLMVTRGKRKADVLTQQATAISVPDSVPKLGIAMQRTRRKAVSGATDLLLEARNIMAEFVDVRAPPRVSESTMAPLFELLRDRANTYRSHGLRAEDVAALGFELTPHRIVLKMILACCRCGPLDAVWRQSNSGSTLLHLAVLHGRASAVELILEGQTSGRRSNSLVCCLDASRRSPLHVACEGNRHGLIDQLVDAGASLEAKNSLGQTPLHVACKHGRLQCVNMLLRAGADMTARDSGGFTPLMWCAGDIEADAESVGSVNLGGVACGRRLINAGANISTLDRRGFSALYWSTKYHLPLMGKDILLETDRRAAAGADAGAVTEQTDSSDSGDESEANMDDEDAEEVADSITGSGSEDRMSDESGVDSDSSAVLTVSEDDIEEDEEDEEDEEVETNRRKSARLSIRSATTGSAISERMLTRRMSTRAAHSSSSSDSSPSSSDSSDSSSDSSDSSSGSSDSSSGSSGGEDNDSESGSDRRSDLGSDGDKITRAATLFGRPKGRRKGGAVRVSGWHDCSSKVFSRYVTDMSFGIEPYPIILDLRPEKTSSSGADMVRREYLSPSQLEKYTVFCRRQRTVNDALALSLARSGYGGALCDFTRVSSKLIAVPAEAAEDSSREDEEVEEEEGLGLGLGQEVERMQRRSARYEASPAEDEEDLCIPCGNITPSPYMRKLIDANSPRIPRFIYSMTVVNEADIEAAVNGVSGAASAEGCAGCKCTGDCRLVPNCPCITKNGQKFPYNSEKTFNFQQPKLFECGPQCGCATYGHRVNRPEQRASAKGKYAKASTKKARLNRDIPPCSLRLTQCGVSGPMVVCETSGKGLGVICLQSYPKGSFICTYTGEEVSEQALSRQENSKIRRLNSIDNNIPSIGKGKGRYKGKGSDKKSINTSLNVINSSSNSFVNYALQVSDAGSDINIDSE